MKTLKTNYLKVTLQLVLIVIALVMFREIIGDWEHSKQGLFGY